ncbi:MAG: c-type cytochrome [Marinibacterium profundimaris]
MTAIPEEIAMRLSLLVPLMLLAAPLGAQDAAEGALIYAQSCATCHGAEARGNGPRPGGTGRWRRFWCCNRPT